MSVRIPMFLTALRPKTSEPPLCPNISESLDIYRLLMWLLSNNFSCPEVLLTLVVFRIPETMPDVITWLKTFTKNCPLIWFSANVQSLLPLANQIPIWTLDKIGIPGFWFPIGTYSNWSPSKCHRVRICFYLLLCHYYQWAVCNYVFLAELCALMVHLTSRLCADNYASESELQI